MRVPIPYGKVVSCHGCHEHLFFLEPDESAKCRQCRKCKNRRHAAGDYTRARRLRKQGHGSERIDRHAIYVRDNGRCHICKKRVKESEMTLDHLVPLIAGGPHRPSNVALAHQSCNSRRGPGRIPAQLRLLG